MSISELHTEVKDVFIPGYKLLKNKIRTKTNKGPKIGGGIAVFIKDDLFDLAHVVPNNNDNSIWIKLQKKNSKSKDLYIGSYYVSPENKKNKLHLFEMLSNEIDIFSKKGDIILQGDFNARTGQKKDFIESDPFFEDLFDQPEENCTPSLPPRNSEDKNDNPRGEELLDFCKTKEFAIINGRKMGDLFGKHTSHQYNGSSAIDFTLTSFDYYDNITFIQVGDYIPWLSDHTPIFTSISLDIDR